MPTNNNSQKTQTTTQIRTLFGANDTAYLNTKFFNMYLSLTVCGKVGVDQNGKPLWDNGITTTLTHDQAANLIQTCKIFLKDPWKPVEVNTQIQRNDTTVTFGVTDTKSPAGFVATLTLSKGKESTTFQFRSDVIKARNEQTGQMVDVQIQTQLYNFVHILDAFISGINSDRHLDKYTDDYAATKDGNNQQQQYQRNNNRGNWNRGNGNNGGNRNWNNNGGGNRNYNNGYQNRNNYNQN